MLRPIIIFIFFLNYTYCFAQQDQLNNISQSESVKNLLPEKILVHSDKSFYISGEIMWFKIYVVEADSYRLQSLSRTAYTELIDQDGKAILQAKIELNRGTGSGSFSIPLNIKSGSYQLRVYTNWMKNNPASIFNKDITVINTQNTFDTTAFILSATKAGVESDNNFPNDKSAANLNNKKPSRFEVQVKTDQNSYQRRNPVEIAISAPLTNSGINANLSVAVYKLNDLNKPDRFADNEQASANIINVTNPISREHPFIPEMQGYVVHIKVKNIKTGKPSEGIPVILSLTGKLADVQYGESDEDGVAYFSLKHIYEPQQLFVKTTPEYENVVELELSKPFLIIPKTSVKQKSIIKNEYLNAVEEMNNSLAINKAFNSDSTDEFYPAKPDSISFYGTPYSTYLLDNYKRFVTMEEVLREYVREVMVRIRDKNYYLLVFSKQLYNLRSYRDYTNNMMDENGPLALIDGIPVTNLNKLIKYDPLKVRKLEVVADRYLIGKTIYDGVLSFTTYKGEFEDLELNKNELLFDNEGWQRQRKLYIPDYKDLQIKKNRIPDFRELLYWDPEVKISKTDSGKISFYTGDLTGKFVVVVKGVSEDGRIVNEMASFEVVK